MKRRNFLKGIVGLAAVPVVGVVVAKPVSPSKSAVYAAVTKAKCDAAAERMGIDLSGGPDGAAALRMATDGTVDVITNERFYVRGIASDYALSQKRLNAMIRGSLDTKISIAQSIYSEGEKP